MGEKILYCNNWKILKILKVSFLIPLNVRYKDYHKRYWLSILTGALKKKGHPIFDHNSSERRGSMLKPGIRFKTVAFWNNFDLYTPWTGEGPGWVERGDRNKRKAGRRGSKERKTCRECQLGSPETDTSALWVC